MFEIQVPDKTLLCALVQAKLEFQFSHREYIRTVSVVYNRRNFAHVSLFLYILASVDFVVPTARPAKNSNSSHLPKSLRQTAQTQIKSGSSLFGIFTSIVGVPIPDNQHFI